MSEMPVSDAWVSRIRSAAANSDDHHVKMFKEQARLAPLQAPEEPEGYRLRTRAQARDLAVTDRR